jgi:hypothetical protein
MAKTKVSQWDSVAANNTDINSININEGCVPSTINNAIREVMAQIKNWQDGASGDSWTSAGTLNITGTLELDGSTGTAGTYLKSLGSGKTPVWSNVYTDLSMGTMSQQNKESVNIDGGTITGTTINGHTVGSNATGNKFVSTGNPSGGANGDIWYKI